MSEIYKNFEPFSEERAVLAKEKASRVFNGNYKDYSEVLLYLIWILAQHYKIPVFDSYFKDRSLDDLIFEVELIRLQRLPPEEHKSEVINQNRKEAEELFDDFEDEEMISPESDDSFNEMAKKFMETNDFLEESNEHK